MGGERKGGTANDSKGFSLSKWYNEVAMDHMGRREERVQLPACLPACIHLSLLSFEVIDFKVVTCWEVRAKN